MPSRSKKPQRKSRRASSVHELSDNEDELSYLLPPCARPRAKTTHEPSSAKAKLTKISRKDQDKKASSHNVKEKSKNFARFRAYKDKEAETRKGTKVQEKKCKSKKANSRSRRTRVSERKDHHHSKKQQVSSSSSSTSTKSSTPDSSETESSSVSQKKTKKKSGKTGEEKCKSKNSRRSILSRTSLWMKNKKDAKEEKEPKDNMAFRLGNMIYEMEENGGWKISLNNFTVHDEISKISTSNQKIAQENNMIRVKNELLLDLIAKKNLQKEKYESELKRLRKYLQPSSSSRFSIGSSLK